MIILGQSMIFCIFKFFADIHFSYTVMVWCNNLLYLKSKTLHSFFFFLFISVCSLDVSIFPSISILWYADDRERFSSQHLTSLPFAVDFVYWLSRSVQYYFIVICLNMSVFAIIYDDLTFLFWMNKKSSTCPSFK